MRKHCWRIIRTISFAVSFGFLPVSLCAQWLNYRTPAIPRTADGKPNLTAPAPRSFGKPDLTGLWQPEPNPYRFDLIQDLKDETIFRPAAEALFLKRVADFRRDDPVTHCLPGGPSDMLAGGLYRIMQSPSLVALLYEGGGGRHREIFMDGRNLPEDPNPAWLGYSIGRWDGDTLIVESAGFNDRSWLDRAGHPHSEKLRVTEKFRRIDFGHIQFQITYDDPETLTRPLTVSLTVHYAPDTEMLENVCNEDEHDTARLSSVANARVSLRPAVLDKYTGTYEFREGSPQVAGFMGKTQAVTVVNGQLYLNALPLIPQSETTFDSTGASAEFLVDGAGRATQLVLSQTEGDARYDRKR